MLEIKFNLENEESFLRGLFDNLPEYCESMRCTKWKYEDFIFHFVDYEDGKSYIITLIEAKKGIRKLIKDYEDGKIFKHLMPRDFFDVGEWDMPMVDALVQYCIFGEIVYC